MLEKMLTRFNRIESVETQVNSLETQVDWGEKIGNVGLGLLRIGCGQVVSMKRISETKRDGILYTEQKGLYSVVERIAALFLAFSLLLPVTLLGAIIGGIATKLSKSHFEAYHPYQMQKGNDQVEEFSSPHLIKNPNEYFWKFKPNLPPKS